MDVSLSMREDSLPKVICIGNVLLVSGIILYFLCGIAASRIAASALIFGLICVDFTVQWFFGLVSPCYALWIYVLRGYVWTCLCQRIVPDSRLVPGIQKEIVSLLVFTV